MVISQASLVKRDYFGGRYEKVGLVFWGEKTRSCAMDRK